MVNGGTLTLASTGSITGNLTVNPGASFVNNGTVNTPGVWQANQGTFTNNSTFLGNLANVGTASNTGTITGSLINGAAGSFNNNGTVTGNVVNMGLLSGNGSHVGSLANSRRISARQLDRHAERQRQLRAEPAAPTRSRSMRAGQSDRINVGGTATHQRRHGAGAAQPGNYAPQHDLHHPQRRRRRDAAPIAVGQRATSPS